MSGHIGVVVMDVVADLVEALIPAGKRCGLLNKNADSAILEWHDHVDSIVLPRMACTPARTRIPSSSASIGASAPSNWLLILNRWSLVMTRTSAWIVAPISRRVDVTRLGRRER